MEEGHWTWGPSMLQQASHAGLRSGGFALCTWCGLRAEWPVVGEGLPCVKVAWPGVGGGTGWGPGLGSQGRAQGALLPQGP